LINYIIYHNNFGTAPFQI